MCFLFDLFVLSRTVTTLHDIGGHDGKPVVPLFVGLKTCVCKISQSPGTPAKPVHIGRGVHQRQELVSKRLDDAQSIRNSKGWLVLAIAHMTRAIRAARATATFFRAGSRLIRRSNQGALTFCRKAAIAPCTNIALR